MYLLLFSRYAGTYDICIQTIKWILIFMCKKKQLWFWFWWINYFPLLSWRLGCVPLDRRNTPNSEQAKNSHYCDDVGLHYKIIYLSDASSLRPKNSGTRRLQFEHKKLNVLHLLYIPSYILCSKRRKKYVLKSKRSRPIVVD